MIIAAGSNMWEGGPQGPAISKGKYTASVKGGGGGGTGSAADYSRVVQLTPKYPAPPPHPRGGGRGGGGGGGGGGRERRQARQRLHPPTP